MDTIQKVLIKAGRKDLAQKYYQKYKQASHIDDLFVPKGWKIISDNSKETIYGNPKYQAKITNRHGGAYNHNPVVAEFSDGSKEYFMNVPSATQAIEKKLA